MVCVCVCVCVWRCEAFDRGCDWTNVMAALYDACLLPVHFSMSIGIANNNLFLTLTMLMTDNKKQQQTITNQQQQTKPFLDFFPFDDHDGAESKIKQPRGSYRHR